MLAAAFLSTAVAVADTADSSGLTIGDFTFNPTGDTSLTPDFTIPPFAEGASGPVTFDLVGSSGNDLGTFTSNADVSNIFGITTTAFTFNDADFSASPLTEGADADAIASVLSDAGLTDADFDGGSLNDAAEALANSDFDVASGHVTGHEVGQALYNSSEGQITIADDSDFSNGELAQALNGVEITPSDIESVLSDAGFTDDDFTGGSLSDVANFLANYGPFDITSGDIGNADIYLPFYAGISISDDSDLDYDDITQAIANSDLGEPSSLADLPTDGTLYSVTDFGFGFENVYEAVPATTEAGAPDVTDILLTPFGNFDVSNFVAALGFEPFDLDASGAFDGGVDATTGGGGLDLGGIFGGLGGDMGGDTGSNVGGDDMGAGDVAGDTGGALGGDVGGDVGATAADALPF
jgi:hypothetical protein